MCLFMVSLSHRWTVSYMVLLITCSDVHILIIWVMYECMMNDLSVNNGNGHLQALYKRVERKMP